MASDDLSLGAAGQAPSTTLEASIDRIIVQSPAVSKVHDPSPIKTDPMLVSLQTSSKKPGHTVLSPRRRKQDSDLTPESCPVTLLAGDEDMMQDFVKLHMMSILRPFADHMRELQDKVERLTGQTVQVQHDVSHHKSRLDQHEDQLLLARNDAAALNSRVDATQGILATLTKEKAALDAGHEMTKASLAKAEEKLRSAELALDALQRSHHEATALMTTRLQSGLSSTDQKISEHVAVRLNNMRTYCKDLHDRQADLLQAVQQNRVNIDSTGQSLEKLTQVLDQRRQTDLESVSCLDAHAKRFEDKLANTDQTLQRYAKSIMAVEEAMEQTKAMTGQIVGVWQIYAQHSEVILSLKEHARRLGKAEEDIALTRGEAANEKQAVCDLLRKLGDQADTNASGIQRLEEVQKMQAKQIQTADKRANDFDAEQQKLWKWIDADEREMESRALWQKGATKKLEEHSAEIEQAQNDFRQAQKNLEITDTNLNDLKTDLDTARDILSKLCPRVDMCYKFLHGFGKGVQEARQNVTGGDCGMLPLVSGTGPSENLPVVPRSPRSSAPRKARMLLWLSEKKDAVSGA